MIVVDASIALAWVFEEKVHADVEAALEYVSDRGAFVPGNFQSEVAHALLQAERRKRIDGADVSAALSDILALPLTVELPDPHVVVATARTYGLTCHDATYLALAIQEQLPLATTDERLRRASISAKRLWRSSNVHRRPAKSR